MVLFAALRSCFSFEKIAPQSDAHFCCSRLERMILSYHIQLKRVARRPHPTPFSLKATDVFKVPSPPPALLSAASPRFPFLLLTHTSGPLTTFLSPRRSAPSGGLRSDRPQHYLPMPPIRYLLLPPSAWMMTARRSLPRWSRRLVLLFL